MSNIAIVVPCYNEEEMLPIYVEKMQALQKEFTEVSLKLYLVNDGSSDNTLNVMRSYIARLSILYTLYQFVT